MESSAETMQNKQYKLITGKIYVGTKPNHFVESLLVKDNTIIYTGKAEDTLNYCKENKISDENLQNIKLGEEQVAMSGFIDTHIHPLICGIAQTNIMLKDVETLSELLDRVKQFINENEDRDFICGIGYRDELFTKDNPISYKILDEISTTKPIAIMRYDGHAYWVNSKTIEMANLTKDSVAPTGGAYAKDGNGDIVGVLYDEAMGVVKQFMPSIPIEVKVGILKEMSSYLLSLGVVAYTDAAIKQKNVKVFTTLYGNEEEAKLLPRCSVSIAFNSPPFDPEKHEEDEKIFEVPDKIANLSNFLSDNRLKDWDSFTVKNKLKVNTVKLFIDGIIESGTALISKPKCPCDKLHAKGDYTFTADQLRIIIDYLYENQLQIHCHCIGDLASTITLNAIEKSISAFKNVPNNTKHYIAHLQVVNEHDFKRFKELNVYTCFSPFWFKTDKFSDELEELIGKERAHEIYPIKSLIENDAKITFGSDWPVSSPNPLDGIEVALTHRELGSTDESTTYIPGQRISIYDAVRAYTIGSAELMGLDKISGTLEVGKLADLIILDKNIFELEANNIHTSHVLTTMVDGIIVYQK